MTLSTPLRTLAVVAALAITAAPMLTGCYSPTHTAPIGGADLRREGVTAASPEQRLVAGIAPVPTAIWRPGKRWHITDDRIRMLLRGSLPDSSLAGQPMTLTAVSSAPTITGDSMVELHFSIGGCDAAYRTAHTPAEFRIRSEFSLPFAVEMAPVEQLDSLLRGKRLYVLTPTWLDSAGDYVKGRRYVPVTVRAVIPGEPQTPARVIFSPNMTARSRRLSPCQ